MKKILACTLLSLALLAGGTVAAYAHGNDPVHNALHIQEGDLTVGSPDAPVRIFEYISMTCPHCAHFHTEVVPELTKEYIDTGKVQLIIREMPWDSLAFAVAKLVRCAPEERRHDFLSVFLKTQEQWLKAGDVLMEVKKLSRLGGLSESQVDGCLLSEDLHNAIAKTRETATKVLKVQATPTLFVNGHKIEGAPKMDTLRALIDKAIEVNAAR